MAVSRAQRRSWGWTLAAAAFVVAAILVWTPLSWETQARNPQGQVTLIEVGILHPFTFAWESWAEGVQFRVAEVRSLRLAGSAALTLAAGMLGAPWCYRRNRQTAEQAVQPDTGKGGDSGSA